ncbi:unnamed protein product, partial [Ascophyllum nodosum]
MFGLLLDVFLNLRQRLATPHLAKLSLVSTLSLFCRPEERGTGSNRGDDTIGSCNMAQAVGYFGSEDRMLDSEQEAEIDGVDPWKAAMQ